MPQATDMRPLSERVGEKLDRLQQNMKDLALLSRSNGPEASEQIRSRFATFQGLDKPETRAAFPEPGEVPVRLTSGEVVDFVATKAMVCPNCGCDDLGSHEMENPYANQDLGYIELPQRCLKCGATWKAVYQLKGLSILNREGKERSFFADEQAGISNLDAPVNAGDR